jgi:hypothetical protein
MPASAGSQARESVLRSRMQNGFQMVNPQLRLPVDFTDDNNLGVTPDEAEELLDRWRRLMAPGLPFVIVPDDVSAQELNQTKPLLLHAIVTVTYFHNLPRQQQMVKQLMRDISERILINNEKTLGVLQGLMVGPLPSLLRSASF